MSKKTKNTNKQEEVNETQQQQEAVDEKVENKEGADTEEAPEVEADTTQEKVDDSDENTQEPTEEVDETAVKIEALEATSKEWQDKYLRLSAEFDNYRRRTLKEKTELTKTASEVVLVELLSVVDDFERALASINQASDATAVKEGVDLIYNKFTAFIKQKGISEIEAKEQIFDVDHHEAITKIPAPNEELKGKVVDVVQKGYMLHDKVVRFAKVVIGE